MTIKSVSCLLISVLLSLSVQAEESILSFHSEIEVQRNGQLKITETIVVNAEGRQIRRGIYRDLPTIYQHPQYGHLGFKYKTPIKVLSVERDGKAEPHHQKQLKNGIRVFFGSENHFLSTGPHTYSFSYMAERQITQSGKYAQIYWNVTGNGWAFSIDQASAKLSFPGEAYVYSQEVWTGRQGQTLSNARFVEDNQLYATQPLMPYEGMTLRMNFDPREMVLAETSNLETLILDNPSLFIGIGLLALLPLFCLGVWYVRGRDPEKGIIVARYRPVEGLSAAAHRAVFFNRTDDTSFAVGVLSAAIKGWLVISKPSSKIFKLKASGEGKELSPSEYMLVKGLFKTRQTVQLGAKYDAKIAALRKRYSGFLKDEFARKSHVDDRLPLFLAAVIGLAGMFLIVKPSADHFPILLPILFFAAFTLITLYRVIKRYSNQAAAYSLVFVVIVLAVFFGFKGFYHLTFSVLWFAVCYCAFIYLIPAPKGSARKTLDDIEGFRLYLSKAEHESLKRLDLPEKTPQLYEELLPFAIALDLETKWSEQFTDVLAAADLDPKTSHGGWYSGDHHTSMSNFAPAIASGLATSVVAASTPPSSSSSGGGGGSSGGGGGGGGGGGW